jgi:hypothetical protein
VERERDVRGEKCWCWVVFRYEIVHWMVSERAGVGVVEFPCWEFAG